MTTYDCSKLLIDFTKAPKGIHLTEAYPELSAFTEFTSATNEEISISICMADVDSPFVKIKDRESMISAIFEFIGMKETPENKEFFDRIFQYKHEKISGCWARYLQIQYQIDFTEWSMTKMTYDFLLFEANKPIGDDDTDKYVARRIKLQAEIKKIGQELKNIESKLFPDSKVKREIALHELKKIIGFPEKYSQERSVI